MTTTTDAGPDVQVSNANTGEVYPSQVRDEVARLDGAATDAGLHTLLQDNHALRAELVRTKAELAQLQSIVSPLEAPWTPDVDPPTLWTEETLIAQWAAAHRDSYDTHTYIAGLHREHRQQWDSVHDDIEALTAHQPADVWDDALRALLAEPVEVDYSYRQTEAWALADMVAGQSRQHNVYAELAPDRINEGESPKAITPDGEMKGSVNGGPDDIPPPEHERQGKDPDLVPEHERQVDGPPHRLPPPPPPPPDNRVARMVEDPERYFTEARERAQQQVDRSDVEAMTEDRQRRDARAERQVQTGPVDEAEPDGWVRATWLTRALAWISGRKRGA